MNDILHGADLHTRVDSSAHQHQPYVISELTHKGDAMTKRVLVVDDYRPVRSMLRSILEPLCFQVEEASNGQQAIDVIDRDQQYDAIFLDIYMPEVDGLRVLERIRQDQEVYSVVVIMCSTDGSLESIESALRSGADEYVMKPFSAEDVRDKLRRLRLIE